MYTISKSEVNEHKHTATRLLARNVFLIFFIRLGFTVVGKSDLKM